MSVRQTTTGASDQRAFISSALNVFRFSGSVVLLSVVVCFFPGCRTARTNPPPRLLVQSSLPAAGAELDVEVSEGFIFVPVKVNGTGTFWFMLDTGSQLDLVHPRSFSEMHIEPLSDLSLRLNESSGHLICRGASFSIGKAEYHPSVVGATEFIERMEQFHGRRIDGILGAGLLTAFVVEIDYAARKLKFNNSKKFNVNHHGTSLRVSEKGGLIFVPITIQFSGQAPMIDKFLVDTGSNSTIGIDTEFLDRRGVSLSSLQLVTNKTAMVGGTMASYLGRVERMQIGDHQFSQPIFDVQEQRLPMSGKAAGLAGCELWRRFRVTLDKRRRTMVLEPNSAFHEPFKRDMSGLVITARGKDLRTYVVEWIRPSSPAAEADFQTGDVIVAVDGKPAAEWTLESLRFHFKESERVCRLIVRRQSAEVSRSITLRPLL